MVPLLQNLRVLVFEDQGLGFGRAHLRLIDCLDLENEGLECELFGHERLARAPFVEHADRWRLDSWFERRLQGLGTRTTTELAR